MEVYKTYKFRIYPNDEQKVLLDKFLGTSRFIYNYCLGYIIEKNIDSKLITFKELYKIFTEIKKDNLWIEEMDQEIITTTLEDLEYAFKRYNSGKSDFPKFKSKLGYYDSYRTICRRWNIYNSEYANIRLDIVNKLLTIPLIKDINIRGYRNKKEFNDRIINVTVIKEAERYYTCILTKAKIKDVEYNPKKMIGIDIGLNNIIVTSDGEKYDSMWKQQEKFDNKLKTMHQKLDRMQKDSNNYKKMKIKIKRQNMKIKNLNKFTTHQITKKIINENDLIFIEDLDVKEMIESSSKFIGRKIGSACFSETIRLLSYKAEWYNKHLIKIDRYYPSSKLCSHCNYKNELLENYRIRVFECPKCGINLDRDINSSINIMDRGIEIIFKNNQCRKIFKLY